MSIASALGALIGKAPDVDELVETAPRPPAFLPLSYRDLLPDPSRTPIGELDGDPVFIDWTSTRAVTLSKGAGDKGEIRNLTTIRTIVADALRSDIDVCVIGYPNHLPGWSSDAAPIKVSLEDRMISTPSRAVEVVRSMIDSPEATMVILATFSMSSGSLASIEKSQELPSVLLDYMDQPGSRLVFADGGDLCEPYDSVPAAIRTRVVAPYFSVRDIGAGSMRTYHSGFEEQDARPADETIEIYDTYVVTGADIVFAATTR